ncbi:MAG: NFACT family protein [Methanoregulaceae archaeon]|nr:NFACT family protein [Methanoregulaceae archaeon]
MATLQGMNGIDLRAVVAELRELLPGWVAKSFQFENRLFGIRFNDRDHNKRLLIVDPGKRVHLVGEFPTPPKVPPMFAALLRKYLADGKILDIRQYGLQRIVIFDIGKREEVFHLVIELFDEGNIVLCREDYTIIKPLSHHRFKDREVIPGVEYRFLGQDPASFSEEAFGAFIRLQDREIVKVLAVDCMLGGMYAEYICRETGIPKESPARDVDTVPLFQSLARLLDRVEHDRRPAIGETGCHPVLLSQDNGTSHFESFNDALSAFYPGNTRLSAVTKPGRKVLAKEEVIRTQQVAAVRKFTERVARNERVVAAIYENYTSVADLIKVLAEAESHLSWQEIQARIQAKPEGPAARIVAVYPAERAVEIDIGEKVKIVVREGIEGNISRYFEEIKKYKRKIAGAKVAMEQKVKAAPKRKVVQPVRPNRWYHRFRWFRTTDGVIVIGGRDASQNEELVKKYLEGGDRFVHADVHGASVVIVKGKTAHMEEAAVFAASYSGAWRSGHFTADVYHVGPDQVSKTPESGEFVGKGAFIVRGERTYFRDVPLQIAIGLEIEPETGVIGGPPSVIGSRAKFSVLLKPGQFEPNDTAKKVLRILRDRAEASGLGPLKHILNTEAVAAFVPPGGSDLLEMP